jgi:hypothetical protein
MPMSVGCDWRSAVSEAVSEGRLLRSRSSLANRRSCSWTSCIGPQKRLIVTLIIRRTGHDYAVTRSPAYDTAGYRQRPQHPSMPQSLFLQTRSLISQMWYPDMPYIRGNNLSRSASPHGDGHAGTPRRHPEQTLVLTIPCQRNVNARQQRH